MSSTDHRLQNVSLQLCFYFAILLILLLASLNIADFLVPKKVLGISTDNLDSQNKTREFWTNFLSKNPNYAPGWEEIGRNDRVQEIDPNYSR